MTEGGAEAMPEEPRRGLERIRWLDPGCTRLFEGTFSLLHCEVKGEQTFRGVFAIQLFPVTHPDQFVSLRYDDMDGKTCEIGVLRDLAEFCEDERALVRASLANHYHEMIVRRIVDLRCEHGLLFFDVETQRGHRAFVMRLQYDRAQEYGANGRILLDVNDNRFVIPDLSALPPADARRFTRHIYW